MRAVIDIDSCAQCVHRRTQAVRKPDKYGAVLRFHLWCMHPKYPENAPQLIGEFLPVELDSSPIPWSCPLAKDENVVDAVLRNPDFVSLYKSVDKRWTLIILVRSQAKHFRGNGPHQVCRMALEYLDEHKDDP